MHMLLRTLLIFLRRKYLKKSSIYERTSISMRVLPVDLDLLRHVNNGMYFSYMDFGRWNMIFSSGIYDFSRSRKWYSVVAGETIRFRKSLKLWDKFTIETQVLGNDEKYFYISQVFLHKGEVMATAMVKVRFLKMSGGTVPALQVIREFGGEEKSPGNISLDWQNFDSNHLI
jgi:YbgC/YbaW family acyl-CoA thioester hydrolase